MQIFSVKGAKLMKSIAAILSISALALASVTPAFAQSNGSSRPNGGNRDGQAAYELACAIMWSFDVPACAELPNYPAKFKRATESATEMATAG
jgi:hypothetical protein